MKIRRLKQSPNIDLNAGQISRYLVEGGGFEPPKLTRQIYSLIPLATREPLQKEALDSAFESSACQI